MSDASSGFADQFRRLLEPELEKLGRSVSSRVGRIRWHTEFPESRVFEVLGLLVFASEVDTTTELAVVSIQFQREPEPMLTMDVTDVESQPLLEATDLGPDLQRKLADDAQLAGKVAAEFLRRSSDVLEHALDARS